MQSSTSERSLAWNPIPNPNDFPNASDSQANASSTAFSAPAQWLAIQFYWSTALETDLITPGWELPLVND